METESGLIRRTLDVGGCRADIVSVNLLKGFENAVFRVETSDEVNRVSVVRVSKPGEKRYSEVCAELDFTEFLSNAGVRVARPLGRPADLGDSVGAWFEFIPGEQTHAVRRFPAHTAFELGRAMGQMHVVAERVPAATAAARPAWWEAENFRLDLLVETAAPGVLRDIQLFMDDIRGHARQELLVHGDLGPGNVIAGRHLHVIDFDDSCRAEAEYDLAVILVRLFANEDSSAMDVERLVPALVSGYRSYRDQAFDLDQLHRYARILLLQAAIAACRRPGCPGLTAPAALTRAWEAVAGPRVLPVVLALAMDRVALALTDATAA